jgi:hypothetical protein
MVKENFLSYSKKNFIIDTSILINGILSNLLLSLIVKET